MRKTVLLLALLLAFASLALAQRRPTSPQRYSGPQMSHPTGLGMMIGEPTGISFKHWVSRNNAIDAGFAWSFAGRGEELHIHADYLWHMPLKSSDPAVRRTSFYIGVGGRARFENDSRVGARVPLGLVHFIKDTPLDVFIEVAPIMDLAPETDMSANGGIGLRYYF
ncbi:MAG: hypothetical protein ACRECJ_03125 [Limisphaerales bacterium]